MKNSNPSDHPKRGYDPLPKQIQFHNSQHQFKLLLCGNGVGKSHALVYEVFKQATQVHPGKIGLICAPTLGLLEAGFLSKWIDVIPPELYKIKGSIGGSKTISVKAKHPISGRIVTSKLLLRTTSSGEASVASINAAFCAFEEMSEEPKFSSYHAVIKRARDPFSYIREGKEISRKCQIIAVAIPPQNLSHWMIDVFGQGIDNIKWFQAVDKEGKEISNSWEDKEKQYITINYSTYENIHLKPSPKEYVENLICGNGATEQHFKRFVLGQYISYAGLIYKEFNPQKHIISSEEISKMKFLKVVGGMDFGDKDPGCFLMVGITDKWQAVVLAEEYHSQMNYGDSGWYRILNDLFKKYPEMKEIYYDPSAAALKRGCQQKFPNKDWIPAENEIIGGINKLRNLMTRDRLLVNSNCKNLLTELKKYIWDPKENGNAVVKANQPDHALDALKYAIASQIKDHNNLTVVRAGSVYSF